MSELTVTTASSAAEPSTSEVPGEAPTEPEALSPLDGLREKLAEARSRIFTDLEVPRWGELMGFRVFVRYSPVSPAFMAKRREDAAKSNDLDAGLIADAEILARSCIGVYAMDPANADVPAAQRHPGDGVTMALRAGNPDGPWTRFDHELAAQLGVPVAPVSGIVRATYMTDGDLTMALAELLDWSAKTSKDAERDFPTP